MRSSVNGTCGSIEIIDLVRKSSGVIIGDVRLENDFAADLKAFKEDVKLDLKADLSLGASNSISGFLSWLPLGRWKTLKSSSSRMRSGADNGWSSDPLSLDGDESDCSLRTGNGLFPRELGVNKELREGDTSLIDSSSNEGMDSLDIVLVESKDSWPVSLPRTSSSSSSSGGLSRKSRGLFPRDMLNSFSETLVCWSMASTVNRCPASLRFRRLLFNLCGGIEVMARSAATDGGIASGEWIVRARRADLSVLLPPL